MERPCLEPMYEEWRDHVKNQSMKNGETLSRTKANGALQLSTTQSRAYRQLKVSYVKTPVQQLARKK